MKSTSLQTLLLTFVLGLTVTVLMTESCKKKKDCPTINCNTGAQNTETCKCDCPTGFSGVNCETEDLCITGNVNCQNGGVCVDGTCDCPDGYLGANCETIDLSKIQVFLTSGKTPLELFNAGVPLDSLYGKLYGGGLLYNLDTANGNVLIATTADQGNTVEWGPFGTDITALPDFSSTSAADMDFNGETNTAAIVAQLGDNGGTDYAAKRCADLVANGYDDWYLPAAGELNEMYKKLGPIAEGGTGQITTGFYWSSSEFYVSSAWLQDFYDGNQYASLKDLFVRCRCVRR